MENDRKELIKKYFEERNNKVSSESHRSRDELAENEVETILYLGKKIYNFEFKENLKVLDVGCGDKFLENSFQQRGIKYFGIDIDHVDFNQDKFPFEDDSFDIIISLAVIEHISKPQNYLNEIKRIVNKSGFIFLSTPNWKYDYKNFFDDYTHVKPYSFASLSKILSDHGFQKIKLYPGLRKKPFWQYNLPFAEFFASILPFTGDAKYMPNFLKGKAKSIFALARK